MPGIVITTDVRSGPVPAGEVVSGQTFMIGTTERGTAVEPKLVRNLTEYKKYFGSYLYSNPGEPQYA